MLKHLIYVASAAALGLVWYGALMFTAIGRVLLSNSPVVVAASLCAISVLLAGLWKKRILTFESLEQGTALALGLPLIGALLFVWGVTALSWLGSGAERPESALDAIRVLIVLAVGTVLSVGVFAFYVIIPMGVLSVYVLRKIGGVLWQQESRLAG